LQTLKHCLQMAQMMLSAIEVRKDIMADEKYRYAFSVEEVNRLVLKGVPFRDAYQQIGAAIERGEFKADTGELKHTHEGSIGNLCNQEIRSMLEQVLQGFHFEKTEQAIQKLLNH
jgi:argininosuccinate lyase